MRFENLSRNREWDRQKRMNLLEATKSALELYGTTDDFVKEHFLASAKLFAQKAKELKERIEKHDYTEQDERDEIFLNGIGKVAQ